jgi:hypothetical protein
MATIVPELFLRLADRISAQYELLLNFETSANLVENQASLSVGTLTKSRLYLDFTGSNNEVLLRAKEFGPAGNDISIELRDPNANNQSLTPLIFGKEIIILLATGSGGAITTTLSEVLTLLQTYKPYYDLIEVVETAATTGLVQEIAKTNLASGLGTNVFTIKARQYGKEGNDLSLTLVDPSAINQSLSITVTDDKHLSVSLATNGSGTITTTAAQLKAAVEANYQTNSLFQITLHDGVGSGVLTALPKTNLSGALNGPYASTVLSKIPGDLSQNADPDVAQMITQAQAADQGLTATSLLKGVQVLENLLGALGTHFSRTGLQSIQNYLTEEELLVHENFSLVNSARVGQTLLAVNVFKKSSVLVATAELDSDPPNPVLTPGTILGIGSGSHSNTNYAAQKLELEIIPATTKASLIVDPTGTQNSLKFTAKNAGIEGNNIKIKYTNPAAINQSLTVTLTVNDTGRHIDISLATNGSGTITTTAAQLKAAVEANTSTNALVLIENVSGDDGSGVVTAMAEAPLQGGYGPNLANSLVLSVTLRDKTNASKTVSDVRFDVGTLPNTRILLAKRAKFTTTLVTNANDQITFTAKELGDSGNSITVCYLNPNGNNQPLSVSVTGKAITVSLATNGSGTITSTATLIKQAISANTSASALVWADLVGDGSGVVNAFAATALTGGEDPDYYFEVTSVTRTSGGVDGDIIKFHSVVERQVTV